MRLPSVTGSTQDGFIRAEPLSPSNQSNQAGRVWGGKNHERKTALPTGSRIRGMDIRSERDKEIGTHLRRPQHYCLRSRLRIAAFRAAKQCVERRLVLILPGILRRRVDDLEERGEAHNATKLRGYHQRSGIAHAGQAVQSQESFECRLAFVLVDCPKDRLTMSTSCRGVACYALDPSTLKVSLGQSTSNRNTSTPPAWPKPPFDASPPRSTIIRLEFHSYIDFAIRTSSPEDISPPAIKKNISPSCQVTTAGVRPSMSPGSGSGPSS